MRRAHVTLLAALSFTGAAGADMVVTLSPESGSLRAAFTLSEPTDRFAFEADYTRQRRDNWTPIGDGWTFDGATLRRSDGEPFEQFELNLAQDSRFYDRAYVVVDRVGASGWALYLPPFRAAEGSTTLRFDGFPRASVVRVGGKTSSDLATPVPARSADADEDELVYAGPADNIAEGPMTVIAGENVPAWLRQRLLADTGAVVEVLTRRFGVPPTTAPTLVVSYGAADGRNVIGGSLDGAVLTFALRGPSLDEAAFVDELTGTAVHEAVHLWNGDVWRSAQNAEQSWLHEGSAEYLASRLTQDRESLRAESQRRLNACTGRQDRRPLASVQAVRYHCGFVIQLAAEAAAVQAGAGDAFDLWHAVFEAADDGTYTAERFLAEATRRGGPKFAELAAQLLGSFESLDLTVLAQRFSGLGVEVGIRTADARESDDIRSLALMPVMAEACRGRHGYWTREDHLVLDTDQRCGDALAGNPAVVSVNGASLLTAVVEAHAAVRDACAARGDVVFGTQSGSSLPPVSCSVDIPPLPAVLEVRALPAFTEP